MKKSVVLCVLSVVLVVILSVVLASCYTKEATIDQSNYNYSSYKIQYGDTLSSIAAENKLPDDTIQAYVDAIKEINGLKSDFIKSGTYLIIMIQK